MPGLEGTDLPREIRRRTGCRTFADNDGNAAALGEARHGAGRGVRSVAMLTLGTGVGGGYVLDGAVVRGGGEMAATFGHLKVRRGGRRCACGARGCLEAYASAWAFRNSALRMDGKELFGAARRGEDRAGRLLDEAADALGTAFAEIAHALNPDVIVVGGGIARGWPRLRPRAIARFREDALPRAFASTRVVRAALGTDAGIVGAACLLDQRGR
jgi:glucokinase